MPDKPIALAADKVSTHLGAHLKRVPLQKNASKEKTHEEQAALALRVAQLYFEKHLSSSEAQNFLHERKLSKHLCQRFGLGFAPEHWQGLTQHYSAPKVREAAEGVGLLRRSEKGTLFDNLRGRVTFPIHNNQGVLCGYGGRKAYIKAQESLEKTEKTAPKYLNSPESLLFKKNELLYGWHFNQANILKKQQVILVEGFIDVIRLAEHGFETAVAPMGTAVSQKQIDMLIDSGVREFFLCFDGDHAGVSATIKSAAALLEQQHPLINIRIIELPNGEDPDSFLLNNGRAAFVDAMKKASPLADFVDQVLSEKIRNGQKNTLLLEDMAGYLLALTPWVESSYGLIRERLIELAQERCDTHCSYESPEHFAQTFFPNAQEKSCLHHWSPWVQIAARWLVHAPEQALPKRSAFFSKAPAHHPDLRALKELAQSLEDASLRSGAQQNDLYAFAKTLGAPAEHEVAQLKNNWQSFIKHSALETHLRKIQDNPWDVAPKMALREQLLGLK